MAADQVVTPAVVVDAYTAMRESVRTDPGTAINDSNQIRALAAALSDDVIDVNEATFDRLVAPTHVEPADSAALLTTAAATLRDLVGDRDALVAAREWKCGTAAANGHEAPDVAATESLLAALADPARSVGDFDRDELRAHIAWFHAIRTFVVRRMGDEQRHAQNQFDAFGVRPSMALLGLHRLIETARGGATVTIEDLIWATEGPERLRGVHSIDSDEFTPPCLRNPGVTP